MSNFLFNPIHGNLKQILAKIDHKYARRNLPEGIYQRNREAWRFQWILSAK